MFMFIHSSSISEGPLLLADQCSGTSGVMRDMGGGGILLEIVILPGV